MDTPTMTPAPTGVPNNTPLTPQEVQSERAKLGINTNPITQNTSLPPQDRFQQLLSRTGAYASTAVKGGNVNSNKGQLNENAGVISKGFGETFKQGAKDVTEDITNIGKNAKEAGGGAGAYALSALSGAGHVAGDVAKTAGGLIGDVISPFLPDSIKSKLGDASKYITEKVSSIPGMTPEIQKGLEDVFNTVSLLGGAKVVEVAPGAISKTGEVVKNAVNEAGKAPGKIVRQLETALSPQIRNVTGETVNPEAMMRHIKEAQGLTKESLKGQGSMTSIENTAHKLFGFEGEVTKGLREGKEMAGKKMNEALADPAVGNAPVDLSANLKSHADFLKKTNLEKRASTMSTADRNLYYQFRDSLYEFQKAQPLTKVDEFLREWQTRNATDPTLNKAITNTVHDINEAAKNTADKVEEATGKQGHPYRESNDEYKKYVIPYNEVKGSLDKGYTSPISGASTGSGDLLRGAISNEGKMKGVMNDIRSLVGEKVKGKSGGLTINDQAHLSTFVHDIYNGMKPTVALKKLSVGFSIPMTAIRTAKNFIAGGSTPDTVIQRLMDVLEKQKKTLSKSP